MEKYDFYRVGQDKDGQDQEAGIDMRKLVHEDIHQPREPKAGEKKMVARDLELGVE